MNNNPQTPTELKPCPFCGKNAQRFFDRRHEWYIVECVGNDADCNSPEFCSCSLDGFETANEADTYWNTRANEKEDK